MIRVCPHSDAQCVHGMGCTFSCATGDYNGTKVPLPRTLSASPTDRQPEPRDTDESSLARVVEALKTLRLVLILASRKYDFDLTGSAAMKQADEALSLLSPEGGGKETAWQPIESAPRDGTLFVVYHPAWGKYRIAQWDNGPRHGEPGWSEPNPHEGWIVRPGANTAFLWSGRPLPQPPVGEQ